MRFLIAIVLLVLLLGGCAAPDDVDRLEKRVDDLEALVTELTNVVVQQSQATESLPGCGNLAGFQAEGRMCEGPNGPEIYGDGLGGF